MSLPNDLSQHLDQQWRKAFAAISEIRDEQVPGLPAGYLEAVALFGLQSNVELAKFTIRTGDQFDPSPGLLKQFERFVSEMAR